MGTKVKALSDPGRRSEWWRFRDKTNLTLVQGPPAVTNPGWGVRQSTGNRKGRGRAGPWGASLRQPATEKREEIRVVETTLFWSVSQGLGDEKGNVKMGRDKQIYYLLHRSRTLEPAS